MKRIVSIALSIAATLILSGSAYAQDHAVKATIPFSFTVNGNWVPAGTYIIGTENANNMILSMRSREQRVNLFALGQIDSKDPGGQGQLVFHKYGDRYFLSEVRYPHSSLDVRLPQTRDEKRAREGTLEAGLHVDDDILVALN